MKNSPAEIGYLRTIEKLSVDGGNVTTNAIAREFDVAPASVTDMVQKLAEKEFVRYEKYKGVSLLPSGKNVVQKAKLDDKIWMRFIKEKLNLLHDETEIALEEFRKIQSETILDKLNIFLNHEEQLQKEKSANSQHQVFHEQQEEKAQKSKKNILSEYQKGQSVKVIGVLDYDFETLEILSFFKIPIGISVKILNHFSFDGSIQISCLDQEYLIPKKLAEKLLVVAC